MRAADLRRTPRGTRVRRTHVNGEAVLEATLEVDLVTSTSLFLSDACTRAELRFPRAQDFTDLGGGRFEVRQAGPWRATYVYQVVAKNSL